VAGTHRRSRRVARRIVAAFVVAALSATAACRREAAPAKAEPQIIWRRIGSWAGRGNSQTESFAGDSGALRVRWETRAGPGGADGRFRLTAHSAISGRPLEQVVDHGGAGAGVGYVSQDPHTFYMSVESTGLAWTFTVEEGIAGEVVGDATRR
jgi:hypothetical protein